MAGTVRYVRKAAGGGRLGEDEFLVGLGQRLVALLKGGYPARARFLNRAQREVVFERDGRIWQCGWLLWLLVDAATTMKGGRLRSRVAGQPGAGGCRKWRRLLKRTSRMSTAICGMLCRKTIRHLRASDAAFFGPRCTSYIFFWHRSKCFHAPVTFPIQLGF